jgi:hypothetical protein
VEPALAHAMIPANRTRYYSAAMFVVVFTLLVVAGLFISMPVEFVPAPVGGTELPGAVPEDELVFIAGVGCSDGALVD